jgi:hypothetical protein
MLRVLDGLVARANQQLGVAASPFVRKRRIVAHSLYGVDITESAVAVTRLRLWLQLVMGAPSAGQDEGCGQLSTMLSLKVRCGDSLLQEVGGIPFVLLRGGEPSPPGWEDSVVQWAGQKQSFYDQDPGCRIQSAEQVHQAERELLLDLVVGRTRVHQSLQRAANVPFVWEIAFAEVLKGERRGFDVVIGNPPYVRHELIRDPQRSGDGDPAPGKGAYKAKLARSVYGAWPRTFGYDWVADKARWKLDARSDLYIYCYFHGLSLLNQQGTLCFITSNSWLDVRYGRDLQEFLLTRGQIKLAIENQAQRSFADAKVNTVIMLLGAAEDAVRPASLSHQVRFVMLTVAFDQVLGPAIWEEVEGVSDRQTTPRCRVSCLEQTELLERGMDRQANRYVGDKWGAIHLRAPDIYWLILEKGKGLLVRLGAVADVRRGVTTGANRFFFVDAEQVAEWGIEAQYLVPALKSPRGCSRIWLDLDESTPTYLFTCHKERGELRGTQALEYIKYGEALGIDRQPTCQSRRRWWDLGSRRGARICCNYLVDRVMRFYASEQPFLTSDNFQALHTELEPEAMAAACNSTICQLAVNTLGRSNFGGGLLKVQTYEVAGLWIPNPQLFGDRVKGIIRHAGLLNLDDQDRHAVDGEVFDLLGLTSGERDAVRGAVTRLVARRLSRAQSLPFPR